MQRRASAVWLGDVKSGQGALSTDSGVLDKTQYSFSSRFANGIGTNPEELLAAAHAGCFAMALSTQLGKAGLAPQKLEVTATITLEIVEGHHAITKSHLDLSAHVPGAPAGRHLTQQSARRKPVALFRNFSAPKSRWTRGLTRALRRRGGPQG